jgi:putative DNA primase/helicase
MNLDQLKSIDLAGFISRHFSITVGKSGMALCPFHEDTVPSMSISQKNGVWLWNCHGPCAIGGTILDFVMKSEDLALPEAARRICELEGIPEETKPTGKSVPVASYSYVDAGGKELYKILRFKPKEFRADRKTAGIPRVLYHLPEVLDADTVWILEGEKDVDNARELGITATTWPFGVNNWKPHYAECLKGKNVIISLDRGYRAEEEKAARDIVKVALTTKIVELPGLTEKDQDISDWLEMNDAQEPEDLKAQLERVAAETPAINAQTLAEAWAMAADEAEETGYLSQDYGHANELSSIFRDRYLWANHRGTWMRWTGRAWSPIAENIMAMCAAHALRFEYARRLQRENDKAKQEDLMMLIRQSNTYARIMGALNFLKGWDGYHIAQATDWDADGWLLNVKNGTLDLHTGKLRVHGPGDLLTKIAPVTYDDALDLGHWKRHIELFLPNEAIRRHVQRHLGRSLVGGHLSEEFPIWFGGGGRGKSTTAKCLQKLLGGYSMSAAPNLLLQTKYDRHPTELADLCGARLIFSIEVADGKQLAEALVKQLTGGEVIKGRYMGQNFFEFSPTWSFVLVANHRPDIPVGGDATWRRIRIVPWLVTLPEDEQRPQDAVVDELLQDGASILRWLLAGLADWQHELHWCPDEVKAATAQYQEEQDRLQGFISECCKVERYSEVGVGELFDAYADWAKNNDIEPLEKKWFGKTVKSKGFSQKKGTPRKWVGLKLLGAGTIKDNDSI